MNDLEVCFRKNVEEQKKIGEDMALIVEKVTSFKNQNK